MPMDSTVDRSLPGRTGQLATFGRAFAAAGTGPHVVVEGEPGIGRTSLLRAAAGLAAARGFQVAWAAGRMAEREHAFGVARRALDAGFPPIPGGGVPGGAAGDETAGDETAGDAAASQAAAHELYRRAVRIAERAPLLLVVDDLQWCDPASLRWLGFLARRSAGVPLVLAVSRPSSCGWDGLDGPDGPDGPGGPEILACLDELTEAFERVELGPLGADGVAAVVRGTLGAQPAGAFTAAALRMTGGHPALLAALLADVGAAGLAPSAQTARRAADLPLPAVERWVRDRLGRASPHAERLLRAAAILGARAGGRVRDGAAPDLAAELAGLDARTAALTADALVAAGFLRDERGLRFARPIVRTAVLRLIPEPERLLGHARAARLLYARGARPALVVEHLLATGPVGDPWAVPVLRAAARAAFGDGAYDVAVTRLRRALDEAPHGPERLQILVDLGRAELRTDVTDAVRHLTEAFESAADPRTAARIAEHLATAMCELEDAKAAIAVLDRAIARLGTNAPAAAAAPAADPAAGLVADLDILALGISARVTSLAYAHRIERLRSRAADRPGAAQAIAGILAYRLSAAGRSRRESVARAREVLALGPPGAMRDFYAYQNAALSLTRAGELDLALRCADVLIARGAALGQPMFAGNGHALRGWVALLAGRLADVVDETQAALAVHAALCHEPGPHGAEIYLIEAHLERGEPAEAARLFRRIGLLEGGGPPPYWAMFSLESRGRYRLLRGDQRGALADFLEAGRQLVDCGVVNPAAGAWRSSAALVLRRLGDEAAALRLATEELTLARGWGASGPVGVALRAVGLIRDDLDALEESVAVLAGSPARLEYAKSLYELGGARLDRRQRDEARGLLRAAYVIAMDCGAEPLVGRIGEALARAGARRPRPRPSGVAALTAQERRIAELAAAGATNKEIAERLFLIQRTVETHLTSVYRKLGIDGRRTLAAALGG
jgi:DNA-binding CsgD family transcriptional regulator